MGKFVDVGDFWINKKYIVGAKTFHYNDDTTDEYYYGCHVFVLGMEKPCIVNDKTASEFMEEVFGSEE